MIKLFVCRFLTVMLFSALQSFKKKETKTGVLSLRFSFFNFEHIPLKFLPNHGIRIHSRYVEKQEQRYHRKVQNIKID